MCIYTCTYTYMYTYIHIYTYIFIYNIYTAARETVLSPAQVQMLLEKGWKIMALMESTWPRRVPRHLARCTSQSFAVWSMEHDATKSPLYICIHI